MTWSIRHGCVAIRVTFFMVLIALAVAACGGGDARVESSTARASLPVAGSSQVAVTLTNLGDRPDQLVDVSTPAALAVEIHRTEIVDQRATMRQHDTADLPPGEPVAFRPGGLHLMMVMPDDTLTIGSTFPLTLRFRHAEALTVDVTVVGVDELLEE